MDRRELHGYIVYAKLHEDEISVSFDVFEEIRWEEEPFFAGYIKWDGCSNWDFLDKGFPLHFCEQLDARNFGVFLSELYDWAQELMPKHDILNNG